MTIKMRHEINMGLVLICVLFSVLFVKFEEVEYLAV